MYIGGFLRCSEPICGLHTAPPQAEATVRLKIPVAAEEDALSWVVRPARAALIQGEVSAYQH